MAGRALDRSTPLRTNYGATVALVCLSTCPGLLLTTVFDLLAPVLAGDLGSSVAALGWVQVAGNGALAVGPVAAIDLVQRMSRRHLVLGLLVVAATGGALQAAALDQPMLLIGHVLQGLATGALIVAALPSLLTGFGARRLPLSAGIGSFVLFGSAVLGPVLAGALAHPGLWRLVFAIPAAVAVLTILLLLSVLPVEADTDPRRPLDLPSIALAVLAAGLIFVGAGGLGSHGVAAPAVALPLAAGVAAAGALLVLGGLRADPLLPVRPLWAPLPVAGTVAAAGGGAAFIVLLSLLRLHLSRVLGLPPVQVGLWLSPAVGGVAVGATLFATLIRTRFVFVVPFTGVAVLGGLAWLGTGLPSAPEAGWLLVASALLGLGGGLAVAPGLLLAALSVRRDLVGAALALVQLLRLIVTYVAGPAALLLLTAAAARRVPGGARERVAPFVQEGAAGSSLQTLRPALLAAEHEVFRLVAIGAGAALALLAAVYLAARVRPHPPRLESYVEHGEPAVGEV